MDFPSCVKRTPSIALYEVLSILVVTSYSELHLANAEAPMELTVAGTLKEVLAELENALCSMVSNVLSAAKVIVVRLLVPLKALL